jgi:hypothetical protein
MQYFGGYNSVGRIPFKPEMSVVTQDQVDGIPKNQQRL